MNKQVILVKSEIDTKKFAVKLAEDLKQGNIIELIGDVGSGKTFFVRALSEALGAKGTSSPSFVIKNEYSARKFRILHFDFYRLENPIIAGEELKEDLLNRDSLIIIEWAKSVNDILPDKRLKVYFKVTGNNSRELTIYK